MLWRFMQSGDNRVRVLLAALAGAFLVLSATPGYPGRSQQRGVSIPDEPALNLQGVTVVSPDTQGATLALPRDPQASWQLLRHILDDLGIKPVEENAGERQLETDWILWTWDPESGEGNSKPPLKALTRTYERHRFQFTVTADPAGKGALIAVRDAARQREIDITPDSEYEWLKWTDAPTQTRAAQSFLRRLQGDIESALSSSIVPATIVPSRHPAPAQAESTGDETSTVPAKGVVAPATVIIEPATTVPPAAAPGAPQLQPGSPGPAARKAVPPPERSVPAYSAQPADSAAAEQMQEAQGLSEQHQPAVPPASPEPAEAAPAPAGRLQPAPAAASVPDEAQRAQSISTPKEPASEPAPPAPVVSAPAPGPLAVQGGLLVSAGIDATWQALNRALDALQVKRQSSDEAQHILTTDWVDGNFDKKNQQFQFESKTEPLWAFSLWGQGRQRHRFQLILIPVEGGAKTMVYAYHTAFQIETDRTPDSEQTLLYWKDHKTEPRIALAFLRRLRLTVNP